MASYGSGKYLAESASCCSIAILIFSSVPRKNCVRAKTLDGPFLAHSGDESQDGLRRFHSLFIQEIRDDGLEKVVQTVSVLLSSARASDLAISFDDSWIRLEVEASISACRHRRARWQDLSALPQPPAQLQMAMTPGLVCDVSQDVPCFLGSCRSPDRQAYGPQGHVSHLLTGAPWPLLDGTNLCSSIFVTPCSFCVISFLSFLFVMKRFSFQVFHVVETIRRGVVDNHAIRRVSESLCFVHRKYILGDQSCSIQQRPAPLQSGRFFRPVHIFKARGIRLIVGSPLILIEQKILNHFKKRKRPRIILHIKILHQLSR